MRTILLAAAIALPLPACAHAMLESASPPVGSTVRALPGAVSLDFSEAVEPRFSTVVVTGPKGEAADRGDLHLAPGNPRRLVLDLAAGGLGTYTVTWHAVSVDTHKTQGSFRFTVAKE